MVTWWQQPRLKEFPQLIPDNILDVLARAYAVIEVGGLQGYGLNEVAVLNDCFTTFAMRGAFF